MNDRAQSAEDLQDGSVMTGNQQEAIHVCCPEDHPVNTWIERWVKERPGASLKRSKEQLSGGNFLFLISCSEIIPLKIRQRYRHVLVIHASDLPKDRGWSPHVWTILEGENEVTVTLLVCDDPIDSGDIWHQECIAFTGTETFNEINTKLFDAELRLMDWALDNCATMQPRMQVGAPSYRRKRTPADSQVFPDQTIAEIFDLLRICDPDCYPAYFEHRGSKYALSMRRLSENS